MRRGFEAALADAPLVADGGMATELWRRLRDESRREGPPNWSAVDVDSLTYTRPDMVRDVHDAYCRAGAHVIGTNTFQAVAPGRRDERPSVYELSHSAARLAVDVRDAWRQRTGGHPRYVAGVVGPAAAPRAGSRATVASSYRRHIEALLDGGVDVLLLETIRDAAFVDMALTAFDEAVRAGADAVPVWMSVSPDGTMPPKVRGEALEAFLRRLPLSRASLVGINCGIGPRAARAHVQAVAAAWPGWVSYRPSLGLPDAAGHYPVAPERFASVVAGTAVEARVRVVGGCCGTTPDCVAALVRRLAPVDGPTRQDLPTP